MKFTKLEKDILTAIASGKTKDDILAEKITTLKCLMNTLSNIYKKTAELVQYRTERNKFDELQKYLKENSVLPFLVGNQPENTTQTETVIKTESTTEKTEEEKEENPETQPIEQELTKTDFQRYLQSLTQREKDLLNFLVVTPNYEKAAEYFTLEKTTIKTHVDNLFSKLQVNSLAELVAVYYRFNGAKINNIDIISDLHIKYINEIDRHKTEIAKLEQKIEVLGELQGEVENAR